MADRILVTGGAGYIGSHACKALAAAGFLPVAVDDLSRGHAWAVKWGPLERLDLRDARSLREAFARHRPAAVLHFAGVTYVGESVEHPDLYYQVNLGGVLSLLAEMRHAGVETLVFSSTAAVYGDPQRLPIPEDHPALPVSPYGRSKRMIEAVLEDHAAAFGLRHASLRYFNAAGADPEGETGEAHDPETHLVPLVLQAARGIRPSVTLYGEDYDTSDGTCIRDYIHVTDLAEAHVLALRQLLQGKSLGALNLGAGRGHSVREVIRACGEVTGTAIPVEAGPRRPGDPPRLVADASRAREVLGWTPRLSDLRTIVETAWAWHRKTGPAAPEGSLSP